MKAIYFLGSFFTKLTGYLFGGVDPLYFLVCVLFLCLGIFLMLLWGTKLRDKSSPSSPVPFSWKYLWTDNFKRYFTSGLCALIALRFMKDLTGWDLNEFRAFCVGLSFDGIALFIKQKTSLFDPKQS